MFREDWGLQDSLGFKERHVHLMFSIPQVMCLFATVNHLQSPFVVREKSNYGMAILYFTLKATKKPIIKIWVIIKTLNLLYYNAMSSSIKVLSELHM